MVNAGVDVINAIRTDANNHNQPKTLTIDNFYITLQTITQKNMEREKLYDNIVKEFNAYFYSLPIQRFGYVKYKIKIPLNYEPNDIKKFINEKKNELMKMA
ncbi:hypothetical protein BDAP_000907 [Binucleata daphniae]